MLQIVGKSKGEVRVYAMKAYGGSRVTTPLILNLGNRCRWDVNCTLQATCLRERNLVSMEQEPTLGFLCSHFLPHLWPKYDTHFTFPPHTIHLLPILTSLILLYSHASHKDVSVNDGPHIRRWSHKIIFFSPGATTPIRGCISQPSSGL